MLWMKDEEKIQGSSKGSKWVKFDTRAQYPNMEVKLYMEYKEIRKKGLKVKGLWFWLCAKLADSYRVGARDQFSIFRQFILGLQKVPSKKYEVSHQHIPKGARRLSIQLYSTYIETYAKKQPKESNLDQWTLRQLANMDQTPLSFSFCDGETYTDTGEQSVWVQGGGSGLDKHQCTVQLTLFSDGEQCVKP